MKLPVSADQYMFVTGAVYLVVGMFDIFVYRFAEPEFISMCWILVLMIPVLFPVRWLVRNSPLWRL